MRTTSLQQQECENYLPTAALAPWHADAGLGELWKEGSGGSCQEAGASGREYPVMQIHPHPATTQIINLGLGAMQHDCSISPPQLLDSFNQELQTQGLPAPAAAEITTWWGGRAGRGTTLATSWEVCRSSPHLLALAIGGRLWASPTEQGMSVFSVWSHSNFIVL